MNIYNLVTSHLLSGSERMDTLTLPACLHLVLTYPTWFKTPAWAMVPSIMGWVSLYQLTTQTNPHRCEYRLTWLEKFSSRRSSQVIQVCGKLKVIIILQFFKACLEVVPTSKAGMRISGSKTIILCIWPAVFLCIEGIVIVFLSNICWRLYCVQ